VIRVAHVISHTGTYGGERFVPALERAQRTAGIDALVITGCSRNRILALSSVLRGLRPDLVHTHLAHAKYWGRIAAILAGVPHIVHTEHGNDFRVPLALRPIRALLHARTDRVVALTHAQALRIATYEGVPSEKIAIVPNGIEVGQLQDADRRVARERISSEAGLRIILAVGRLDPVKRYDRAIEALALMRADVHLYIAGEGRDRERLVQIAIERGVAERVHLLGYRTDVPALLSAADVVLNTSESEAMPLSLIEALCAGVPVVATPWPGATELLGTNAIVADGFESQPIAAAVAAALRGAIPRATPLSQVRERFSIERATALYAAVYAEVLGLVPARHASPPPGSAALDGLPR
jgi:glycosyltransferase involved in cell wall biosynthesis